MFFLLNIYFLNMSKLNLILYLGILSLINSLLVDIKDDFDLNIEYRLEKQETNWLKRGQLTFRTKDKDTYKSTASLMDFIITPQMKKEISKECKLNGNYILQLSNPKNKTQRYYTTINPCDLVSSRYHDKLLINTFTPIEDNKIKSFRYVADEDFEDDFLDDEGDDEEIVRNTKKKKKTFTKIELSQVKKVDGPLFSEEDDGAEEITKQKKENKQPQSFWGRYWYIIAIVMFMMMMNGGQDPQAAQGQQGQGQQSAAGAGAGQAK